MRPWHPRWWHQLPRVVVVVSILAFKPAALAGLVRPPGTGSWRCYRSSGASRMKSFAWPARGGMTFLVAPGLWLQRLTTRRPAADQVEVAIAALDAC